MKLGPSQSPEYPIPKDAVNEFKAPGRLKGQDVWDVIPSYPHCGAALQPRARCAPGEAGQRREALLRNKATLIGPACRRCCV